MRRRDTFLFLSEGRSVNEIRLKYRSAYTTSEYAQLNLFWRDTGRGDMQSPPQGSAVLLFPEPAEKTVTIWVDGRVDQLWFQFKNQPASFQFLDIVLLVPQADDSRPDP